MKKSIVFLIIALALLLYCLDKKSLRFSFYNNTNHSVLLEVEIDGHSVYKELLDVNDLVAQVFTHEMNMGFHEIKVTDVESGISTQYDIFLFKDQIIYVATLYGNEEQYIEVNFEYFPMLSNW